MAHDIESTRRNMLHSEYDTAQGIRQACYENGLSLAMTVAIVYKCGLIDGSACRTAQATAQQPDNDSSDGGCKS